MPTRANALAIMAKAPIAGTVKTRLVPPLTHDQTTDLYRAILADQLEHLKTLASVDLYLAFTPSDAASLIQEIAPSSFRCFPQRGNDLGERMNAVFEALWSSEYSNIILIGSDLPALPLSFLQKAFELLATPGNRIVLGPSRDGGYYLIGMNQPTPEVFENMTWSHSQVLAQTMERLDAMSVKPELLPTWFDLDTLDDLKELQSNSDVTTRNAMKQTLKFLETLNF